MTDASRHLVVRSVLPLGALAYLVAILLTRVGFTDPAIHPVPDADPWLVVAHIVAGLGLISAGLGALVLGVSIRTGTIATVAGMAWFAPALTGLALERPLIRALGSAAVPLVMPLLAHLVLSLTTHGPLSRRASRVLLVVYPLTIAIAVGVLLTYAPLYDPRCVVGCGLSDAFLAVGAEDRRILRIAAPASTLVIGAWLAAYAVRGLVGRAPGSTSNLLGWVGGLLVGAAAAAGSTARLVRTIGIRVPDGATDDVETVAAVALAAGVATLAAGLLRDVVHAVAARRRIHHLAEYMASAPEPGSLAVALAKALDDSTVHVGHWVSDERRFVDVDGAPFDEGAIGAGRTATIIRRGGTPIAIVEHRDTIQPELVSQELRPQVLVALDNERLRASRLSQLRELRASRARIVGVGDAERRRVERDLHDGAQQRLLAITFDLRLGRLEAERAGDARRALQLATAEELALDLVDELRRLCRGIHPEVLSQAGLVPALTSLAEEAAIPVEIQADVPGRLPSAVETAAYEVAVASLDWATHSAAHRLVLVLSTAAGQLTMEASDGRPEPLEVPVRLSDRVGAAGGELLSGASSTGWYLRAVMPCG